jgi:hypothetical protein
MQLSLSGPDELSYSRGWLYTSQTDAAFLRRNAVTTSMFPGLSLFLGCMGEDKRQEW